MTMARYRSWGLEADRGAGWWNQATCRGRQPMFFTRDHTIAGQARHLCRAHCPVLDACASEAARLTPVGAVQAGLWYADKNQQRRRATITPTSRPRLRTVVRPPTPAHPSTRPAGGHNMTGPNGIKPADPQAQQIAAVEAFAFANYRVLAGQLGAINTLLAMLPLDAMLAANRRHQSTSVLTLPAQTTPEQAQAIAAGLRADEKVITAALNLARTVAAVTQGGA